ncbi:uncharacterized protein (DUF58 family) [Aurantimicrobium minutum]|uniref:DUF4333 domain-containing protein n=1 Tax=Aurantimicrobium minutum TaxID=708131 RepID=UPI0024076D7F|nr:DUF4333 domain-containing protein [Aurantimicrobium minutum]MDF9809687.1 uncharacterized protein (DUF58 family) [Aurantimicrobium minutum]
MTKDHIVNGEVSSEVKDSPTFRDVFRHMSNVTTAWLGVAAGSLFVALVGIILLSTGFLSLNVNGLVHLDSKRVELQIQADYKNNLGVIATVECPKDLVAPKNFSFKCMAQSGASVATVEVTITDVIGNIIWTPQSDLPIG